MTDDFSGMRSLGAERADRSKNASDWTPRECLIEVLRKLDSGETQADNLVVVWGGTRKDEYGKEHTHFRAAGPSTLMSLGLLTSAIFKMQE
jgi:hypothetical protein